MEPKLNLQVFLHINTYLRPLELCNWIISCKSHHTLFHSHEYQLQWCHLFQRNQINECDMESLFREMFTEHDTSDDRYYKLKVDITRYPTLQLESMLMWLKGHSQARLGGEERHKTDYEILQLEMVVKLNNRLALSESKDGADLKKAIDMGDYYTSPLTYAQYLQDKYVKDMHSNRPRPKFEDYYHNYEDESVQIKTCDEQFERDNRPIVYPQIYRWYRCAMLYGNIKAYIHISNFINSEMKTYTGDIPRYAQQVLMLGYDVSDIYSEYNKQWEVRYGLPEADDDENSHNLGFTDIEKWKDKLDSAIQIYLRVSPYRPAWIPLSEDYDYDGHEVNSYPSYRIYLIHILRLGHEKFPKEVISTLNLPKYQELWYKIPELLQFLAENSDKSDSDYVRYSLELFRIPRPARPTSKAHFIEAYLPKIKDLLMTEEGERVLSQMFKSN